MSKELDDAYFRSTPCTHHEPLLSKLVDCVDMLEERIKGLLGANVYVGDTDTLPAGSEATAKASKHGYDTMLEFGIPRGKDGSDAESTDVRIAGTSITVDGVADIPIASSEGAGVVKTSAAYATSMNNDVIQIVPAGLAIIDGRTPGRGGVSGYRPIVPNTIDYAVKTAMCDGKGAAWTDAEEL